MHHLFLKSTHYSFDDFPRTNELFLKTKPIDLDNNFTLILAEKYFCGNAMDKWTYDYNAKMIIIRINYRRPVEVLSAG